VRSLVVGPTLALFALSSSPASGPDPITAMKLTRPGPAEAEAAREPPGAGERGYPLVASDGQGFALRFYWLAVEDGYHPDEEHVPLYNRSGFFIGTYPAPFVASLRMEGSGVLGDGRVINYAGRCRYGVGTCYEPLDEEEFPFGRGAGRRPLVPFKSVAVDPRLVALGEPLYIPEFDGHIMPDGSVHDGCVRADDTGGNIKMRKMDFFVVSYQNFRLLLDALDGLDSVTPHIEHPRCAYLRPD
jgi:3D domain